MASWILSSLLIIIILHIINNYAKHSRYQLAVKLRYENGNGLGTLREGITTSSLGRDLIGTHRENEGSLHQELPGREQF